MQNFFVKNLVFHFSKCILSVLILQKGNAMHLLREAFEKGHKIEFNVLEKEINVATLKPYLNTENNRKHVIDFMKKAVECE